MKAVFYITGPAMSGKTRLALQLKNHIEFDDYFTVKTDDEIISELKNHDNVVVTNQVHVEYREKALRKKAIENKAFFYCLKLEPFKI